jgi:molybdate transport system ATP-binding protein
MITSSPIPDQLSFRAPEQLSFRAVKMLNTTEGKRPLDLAFRIQTGKLLTLYGPSGAGKTTILRILAGLTMPDSGHIQMEGEVWYDSEKKINIPARKRSVGLVFQDFALFPHLTVRQQLEFALQKGQDPSIIPDLLEFMELEKLQDIRPQHLSGGATTKSGPGKGDHKKTRPPPAGRAAVGTGR